MHVIFGVRSRLIFAARRRGGRMFISKVNYRPSARKREAPQDAGLSDSPEEGTGLEATETLP
jgi:hypothetical protein